METEMQPIGIYHEKQIRQLCLIHTLNNLFQERIFTRIHLNTIAKNLAAEGDANLNNKKSCCYYCLYWCIPGPHHHPWMGNYDANVLSVALQEKGKTLTWHDGRQGVDSINLDDPRLFGIVVNVPITQWGGLLEGRHWIGLRKINGTWYDLDSDISSPNPLPTDDQVRVYLNQTLRMYGGEIMLVHNNVDA